MPAKDQQTLSVPAWLAYGPCRPNQVMVETTTCGATSAKLLGGEAAVVQYHRRAARQRPQPLRLGSGVQRTLALLALR